MFSHPMSPEMIRIVHERQIQEAATRRANLRLADPHRERPALRWLIGVTLVRAGQAIANEPLRTVHVVRSRPGVSGC